MNHIIASCMPVLLAVLEPLIAVVRGALLAITFVIFKPLELLLALTPLGSLQRRYSHASDCIEHLARETMRMSETCDDLLVHDQRRAYAERLLAPAEHPTWYAQVPKHLRRSIVSHGRIRETGFAPAPLLAGNTLTPAFIERAWASAVSSGLRAAWIGFLGVVALAWFFGDVGGRALQQPVDIGISESQPIGPTRLGVADVARSYRDVFSQTDLETFNDQFAAANDVRVAHAPVWEARTTAVVAWPLRVLMRATAALLAGLAAGRLMFVGRLRWLTHDAIELRVVHLRKPFREALQKWRFFLADRHTNDKGFNDQVHFAMHIDRSPLLYFGDAEGEAEFSGHLLGPRQGHEVCHSIVDALQHHEVLGGSGESKSRDFYIPLLGQLLEYRKQGYPIATYITDEKGAIVEDVVRVARKLGLEKELLVIGTGPEDYRVDLMEAGRPVLIAEFIKSAARQAGAGQGGDDFWLEMGNDLMLNIWTVTEAAERTLPGVAWLERHGMRLHSIKAALTLATIDDELAQVVSMVVESLRSPQDYRRLAELDTDALHSAMVYVTDVWMPMHEATRDGIRANLRKALRTFTFKPEMAEGFADGVGERLIPASEMHSNRIKVLNVSQIEHGSAGRMVNIMLKTMFFKQARDVQQQDPAFAERRLAWWFDPDLEDPEKDDYYLEFFLADEYQSLITSDPASGYSDATVWNVLRSAGVAGVTISQGIGAYEYAIGRDATANIRRQWRSKHFLRTEDTATIEEAKKLVGKTMRFQVSDWDHYESMAAVRRELLTDPDNLGSVSWNTGYDDLGVLGCTLHDEIAFGTWDAAFEVDQRFILEVSSGPTGVSGPTSVGTKQAAVWRREDRQSQAMQHGVLDTDVLRDEQIMQMTRGRELTLLQVAGGTQVDIIRLNARAYRSYSDDETVAAGAWL